MKIHDLPDPVTASKADWSIADTCISFTPNSASRDAKNKCQSSTLKQFGHGYVLEYITQGFEQPNPGYEDDADYKADRERHEVFAGALIAVHRLQHSSLPLSTIYGEERYKHIQDMWARGGRRFRWDVAFPIVERYDIKDKPKAKTVFGQELYETLYKRSSNGLRRLTDAHRAAIASLDIEPREVVPNRYIADDAADEREMLNKLYRDFDADEVFRSALEGMTEERKVRFRHRSVAAMRDFLRSRADTMFCDSCGFDPATHPDCQGLKPRSLLDVHHKLHLREGPRETTRSDLGLRCPRCHRIEHVRSRNA